MFRHESPDGLPLCRWVRVDGHGVPMAVPPLLGGYDPGGDIRPMIQDLRLHERIGEWRLSVQASADHYCSPRVDGLPFEEYTHYEVGIFAGRGRFLAPSEVHPSLEDLDVHFAMGCPGGWVPTAGVERIRQGMRARS